MENKTFPTSETQTESQEKRSSGEHNNRSSSSKKQEDWHCAAFLHAAGTNDDERERGARAPGGPEERGVPVSHSPVRPVARGQSLLILRKHSGQKEQDPNGVTYEGVDWDVDGDG
jgi:hypothetical protein